MKLEQLVDAALACGAYKAQIIPVTQVITSEEFRKVCQSNGCGSYGRCWVCPPDVGDIQLLIARLRAYANGLLYQTVTPIEDSFDIEGMLEAGQAHTRLSQRIHQAVTPLLSAPCLHLTCGGCRLCDECTRREGLPCRHPDEALPSLEGYGVDVYQTTRDTSLHYINGQNTVTYFGMVLFGEADLCIS